MYEKIYKALVMDAKQLDFSEVNLECELVAFDESIRTSYTFLHTLNLRANHGITGNFQTWISSCADLVVLNLSSCTGITTTLAPLIDCNALEELNLAGCIGVEGDLKPLVNCTRMRIMNFRSCWKLTGTLEPLAGFVDLEFLDLFACYKLTGTLEPLANCACLEQLLIFGCRGLEGPVEPLTNCLELQQLTAADTNLEGARKMTLQIEQWGTMGLSLNVGDQKKAKKTVDPFSNEYQADKIVSGKSKQQFTRRAHRQI